MDLGLQGKLDKLSGMVITNLSDGKVSAKTGSAIPQVPMLYIPYGQNRKIEAGIEYNDIANSAIKTNSPKSPEKTSPTMPSKKLLNFTTNIEKPCSEVQRIGC